MERGLPLRLSWTGLYVSAESTSTVLVADIWDLAVTGAGMTPTYMVPVL